MAAGPRSRVEGQQQGGGDQGLSDLLDTRLGFVIAEGTQAVVLAMADVARPSWMNTYQAAQVATRLGAPCTNLVNFESTVRA